MWKHNVEACKMYLSDNTEFFGFLKSPPIFHGVQNSFSFSNWYSRDCEEPFQQKKKETNILFWMKTAIFEIIFFRNS